MATQIQIKVRNATGQIQWFTVVDNISSQTVLNDNLEIDEVRQLTIASDANGQGDITYQPKGYLSTQRNGLDDGDVVDMS